MCVICVPVRSLNSSPARWPGEPLPTDAKERLPGFALASAISSATVLARELRVRHQDLRQRRDHADRLEVLRGVERQLRVDRRIDGVRRQREQHGVAVGRRLGRRSRCRSSRPRRRGCRSRSAGRAAPRSAPARCARSRRCRRRAGRARRSGSACRDSRCAVWRLRRERRRERRGAEHGERAARSVERFIPVSCLLVGESSAARPAPGRPGSPAWRWRRARRR